MADDTLRDLLNERDTSVSRVSDDGDSSGIGGAPLQEATPEASKTALEVDNWTLRRGAEINREWGALKVETVPDETIVADTHEALFAPSPKLADNCADSRRETWFKQLIETPEFAALRHTTVLNTDMAAIAAHEICQSYVEYVTADDERRAQGNGDAEGCDGGIEGEVDRIGSIGKAIQDAKQSASDAKDFAGGLGSGSPGSPLDRAIIAKYFKQSRRHEMLREVLRLAGRFKSRCATLQKNKVTSVSGEIVGVNFAGDIAKLVPVERLALSSDDACIRERAEFRLLRRRALSYKHRVRKPAQAGPIVVTVDESGSMGGDKINVAKALALTMAWLAQQQRRWIALMGFSGTSGEEVEHHELVLPPGKRRPEDLIAWVEHFFSGGSDFDSPCKIVPELWPTWIAQGLVTGKTDHIILSDAIVRMTPERIAAYKAWATQNKVKTYGIGLGATETYGRCYNYLPLVSDRYWNIVNPATFADDSQALETVLSI